VPTLSLPESPHAPGLNPVSIYYREFGGGKPLVFLHGGWGYEIYPFDKQIAEFSSQYHILIPDRSGYGHSTRVAAEMPLDFHRRAAQETFAFLDALGIESANLWGHSDGAVIAAMMGLMAPNRCASVILEASHFLRKKPGSRSFFERFAAHPADLSDETRRLLAEDHGESNWQTVLRRNCATWFRIADSVKQADEDLYDGRLGELLVPTLFLHGSRDPRTEPGEMERVRQALPRATIHFIAAGQHSPHMEEDAWKECNLAASEFLQRHA
jgi:pimeloyl-ACP methyl ester carboxylesterase